MHATVKPCDDWIRWDGNVECKSIDGFNVSCAKCNSEYVSVEVSFSPDDPPHCGIVFHCAQCRSREVVYNVVVCDSEVARASA